MRAILIDPKTKTLTEIQITDDDAEHVAIIRNGRPEPEQDYTLLIYRGPELNIKNKTGKDLIIIDNYPGDDDGPGFILDDGDDRDFIQGRALALHFDKNDPEREVVGDLLISLEELTKRIRFVNASEFS